MKANHAIAAVLGLALAGSLSAQIGDPLPQVEVKSFGNSAATKLDDFAGRAMIVEVFAFW